MCDMDGAVCTGLVCDTDGQIFVAMKCKVVKKIQHELDLLCQTSFHTSTSSLWLMLENPRQQ